MVELSERRGEWSLVLGILLVGLGAAFLLDNFDVIYIGAPAYRFWPLILVAIGVSKMLMAETYRDRRKGFAWIFIGLWFLVTVLHMFGLTFHTSWPLLLIGWGINAIWRASTPYPEGRISRG